jgi:hypothetical protein
MSSRRALLALIICFTLLVSSVLLYRAFVGESAEGQRQNIRTQLSRCAAAPDPDACRVGLFESFAKREGVAAALSLIHEMIAETPAFGGTCHDIIHHVGHVAVREYGSFEAAYTRGNYDCGNGYFHGVVEEVLRAKGDDTFTPENVAHFCDDAPVPATNTKAFAALNCVHGLGHALVFRSGGSLVPALPSCANIKGDEFKAECAAGAFMENMTGRLSAREQGEPDKNPSLTCASIAGDTHRCWVALASFTIALLEHGLGDAVTFCSSFGSPAYRVACGNGLGKAVSVGREDRAASEEYCRAHSAQFVSDCVNGAVVEEGGAERSPLYSPAFKLLSWPQSTGTDPLIGNVEMLR